MIPGAALAIALFLYIQDNEQKSIDYRLQLAFDEHYHALDAEGDVLDKLLQGLRGLYAASEKVERHEFANYVRNAVLRHHYIKGVSWAPRIDGDSPAYPVQFVEPETYRASMSGLDLAADTTLRQQLQAAGRDRQLLIRAAQRDPQEQRLQSIRLFLPIYHPDNRRLQGFIGLLLDFDEFVEAALAQRTTARRSMNLAILNRNNNRLLLYHSVDDQVRPVLRPDLNVQKNDYQRPLHILDQDWTLLIRPVPGRFPDQLSLMPWFALFATLAISLLITGVINSTLSRRKYAETRIEEHTRALRKSEERLARLYDIIASDLDFADKTRKLLAYGRDQLDLQFGVLSRVSQGEITILYASTPAGQLEEGRTYPLNESYCSQTLNNQVITSVAHVGKSDWRHLPCYAQHPLESYIGTPIHTGRRLYGTLSFSDPEPRDTPFSQAEQELVQLIAQWLSMELAHIQFEEQLVEQRNTISHILESTAEAFVAVDREQTILYANSLTRSLLNLEAEQLVGQPLQTVAPELLTLLDKTLDDTLRNGRADQFDCFYPASAKWLEVAIHPTLQGASLSLRDITESKANAEMLSHTLGIKNAILNSANFTIIATDVNGTIMSFNNAAERTLGYAASEVIGRHNPMLFHDPREIALRAHELSEELETDIEPGFEAFIALARRGIPDEQEWTYLCRDGSRVPVLLSITEMTDAHGNSIGFLGIGVDITERKRIERLRDEFVSTVSHELRTPLTSIRGSLGLLSGNLGEQLPEQALSLIDIASRNAERLLHLINDILDINKIESGEMAFDYQPLRVSGFLQQAVENNLAYARPFDVDLVLADTLPDVELFADEHRLMQVMNNLLSNAVKFSPAHSRVEIDANIQQHFVRISVTDHGKGIAEEFHQKVFDRFGQADASDSRNTGGTGLGLSIARAIVEQHGGQINFVSQPGIGTTFYFDMPLYQQQSITRIKDQIISLAPPRPHRLLICEDDADVAGLLQLMLARHGYQGDITHSAEQARAALAQHHYDALLLDILLPDRHGLDLIRQLRESAATRQLPIIVVSAIANEARNQLEGGMADIIDWLDKPLDQARLLQSVHHALQHLPDKPRVLYVEDDPDLQQLVALMLQDQVILSAARTLQEAEALLDAQRFDLLLLDITLPDGSGLSLLETLKAHPMPPATVIFSNHEPDADTTRQVSVALRKSDTSQQTLLETLAACLRQRARHFAHTDDDPGDR
ncbi:PAS domain S-box-containing protein [Thiohalophilus thiocyanatoxydans]|uniref:histidine kinase n=2 Tax=Thiohalophilus thiocyanatoxydans TaxID=381308 RepID=A0A4R8IHG9_9GAMM|nr:PAS domain S-box-containing protein [Thiohalophilus thiocyanatoxydans]